MTVFQMKICNMTLGDETEEKTTIEVEDINNGFELTFEESHERYSTFFTEDEFFEFMMLIMGCWYFGRS